MIEDQPTIEPIPENRPLSQEEADLVKWLLEHGWNKTAANFIPQIERLRVVSRCGCGCRSIDFSVDNIEPDYSVGLETLSDYYWGEGGKDLCGIFVFQRGGRLAGLELYSVDGMVTPKNLPNLTELTEFTEIPTSPTA